MILSYDETVNGVVADLNLSEAAFDLKTKTLTTFAKGRGIGDCGQTSKTLVAVSPYGNVAVKTVEIRAKIKCDGRMNNWPVVFKQK